MTIYDKRIACFSYSDQIFWTAELFVLQLASDLRMFHFEWLFAALIWQLMRAYTLSILTQLANTGSPIVEKEIVTWVNKKLASAKKTSSLRSFQVSGFPRLQTVEFGNLSYFHSNLRESSSHKNALLHRIHR
jgi:hypothetical protein